MCLCTFAFLHKTKYLERKFFMQDEKKFVSTYQLTELLRKDKNIEPEHFKEQMLKILNVFNDEFISKKIEYFFKTATKSPQEKVSLTITDESIMHLFGIAYYALDRRLTLSQFNQPSFAKKFFNDFKNNNLDLDKCWVESLDKVKDKMEALKFLPDIKTNKVRIGGYGKLRSISMTNTLRTSKTFLGLGLYHESENSVPRTCLNLKADINARNNPVFRNVHRCSKIIEYRRLPTGTWEKVNQQVFILNKKNKKKAKKKHY